MDLPTLKEFVTNTKTTSLALVWWSIPRQGLEPCIPIYRLNRRRKQPWAKRN